MKFIEESSWKKPLDLKLISDVLAEHSYISTVISLEADRNDYVNIFKKTSCERTNRHLALQKVS